VDRVQGYTEKVFPRRELTCGKHSAHLGRLVEGKKLHGVITKEYAGSDLARLNGKERELSSSKSPR